MSGLSVIIPSRDVRNLVPCVEAVRKHEPEARIIVVDDGVDFNEWQCRGLVTDDLARRGIWLVEGVKPFVFARNCNLGINGAGTDDVVLLNDDAILESPGGFTLMQEAAREHGFGLVSATTNLAGNPAQWRQGTTGVRTLNGNTPGNSFPTVAFVCVLIPRTTINAVGLMDERFGGMTPEGKRIYGFCDSDYCRRVHDAGLTIGIHDGCFMDHDKLRSSFRSEPFDMEAARQIYLRKWGKM